MRVFPLPYYRTISGIWNSTLYCNLEDLFFFYSFPVKSWFSLCTLHIIKIPLFRVMATIRRSRYHELYDSSKLKQLNFPNLCVQNNLQKDPAYKTYSLIHDKGHTGEYNSGPKLHILCLTLQEDSYFEKNSAAACMLLQP